MKFPCQVCYVQYEGSDERERSVLIVDAIMAEIEAYGLQIVESSSEFSNTQP